MYADKYLPAVVLATHYTVVETVGCLPTYFSTKLPPWWQNPTTIKEA